MRTSLVSYMTLYEQPYMSSPLKEAEEAPTHPTFLRPAMICQVPASSPEQGRVRLECGPQDSRPVTVITGQLFSLTLANLFGVFVGFQAQGAKTIATAETDTVVFSW